MTSHQMLIASSQSYNAAIDNLTVNQVHGQVILHKISHSV